MKILTDDHWELIIQQLEKAQARIKELEQVNLSLMDRLLIQQGQLPIEQVTQQVVQKEIQSNQDFLEQLTCETIGSDPDEGDNEKQSS